MKLIYIFLISFLALGVVSAGILSSDSFKKNKDDSFTKTEQKTVETTYPSLNKINEMINDMEKCKEDKEYLEAYNTKDTRIGEAIANQIMELDSCSLELDYYKELKKEFEKIK